jgi:hypothetical protein
MKTLWIPCRWLSERERSFRLVALRAHETDGLGKPYAYAIRKTLAIANTACKYISQQAWCIVYNLVSSDVDNCKEIAC